MLCHRRSAEPRRAILCSQTFQTDGPYPLVCREHNFSICAGNPEPTINEVGFKQVSQITGNPTLPAQTALVEANPVIDDGEAGMRGTKCPECNLYLSTAPAGETVA